MLRTLHCVQESSDRLDLLFGQQHRCMTNTVELDQIRLRPAPAHSCRRLARQKVRFGAADSSNGPTSLTTRCVTGVLGCAAKAIPRSPPIEVPIQATRSARAWARKAVSVVR